MARRSPMSEPAIHRRFVDTARRPDRDLTLIGKIALGRQTVARLERGVVDRISQF